MESQADASSSLVGPVTGNEEVDKSPAIDDGSFGEAWFSEDFCEDAELHNEWKLRRDKLYTAGYREGTLEGQKDAAQDGFNEGFKDSVLIGYNWGIVRGVLRAFAHIPDELKEKLIEDNEVRKELLKLHDEVDSISTGDALKLCYDNIPDESPVEEGTTVNSCLLTHQSGSGGLETYIRKFESLLLKSPALSVLLKRNEKGGS